jgi:hypothetical protein
LWTKFGKVRLTHATGFVIKGNLSTFSIMLHQLSLGKFTVCRYSLPPNGWCQASASICKIVFRNFLMFCKTYINLVDWPFEFASKVQHWRVLWCLHHAARHVCAASFHWAATFYFGEFAELNNDEIMLYTWWLQRYLPTQSASNRRSKIKQKCNLKLTVSFLKVSVYVTRDERPLEFLKLTF